MLSSAVSQLKNLNFLKLDLCENNIEVKESSLFFSELSELKNLNFLCLVLNENRIEDLEALSFGLSQL